MTRFTVLLVLIATTAAAQAQRGPGMFELSASGSVGSVRLTTDVSTEGASGSYSSSESYASLVFRTGIIFFHGLEFEPEFMVTAQEGRKGAYAFSGNLVYNFMIRRSPVMPFLLAGYGAANAIPRFQRPTDPITADPEISVFNAGAGLKFFVSRQVAIRVEYRFQMYEHSYEISEPPYSSDVKQRWYFNDVYAGLSIFLP